MLRAIRLLGLAALAVWAAFATHRVWAYPSLARQTKAACAACHSSPAGGAGLTTAGKAFKADAAKLPSSAAKGAEYVGANLCQMCHLRQFKSWRTTAHAHAFATLGSADTAAVNTMARKLKLVITGAPNQTDACVTCHVTGPGLASGYPAADSTKNANLMNVTCEACHGPGSLHLAATTPEERKKTINRGVTAKLCTNCHTPATSPTFAFEEFRARGVHVLPAAPPPATK